MSWKPDFANDPLFIAFDKAIAIADAELEAEAVFAENLMADIDSGLPLIESADELIANDLPLPPEIIKGFLHQGLKGVLGSSSKARKTWILLDLGLAVSLGIPFWGKQTIQGPVLYINFEIPPAFLRSRLIKLKECRGIDTSPLLHVWNLRGHAAPLWKLLPEFLRRLIRGQYSIVIIDPIYKTGGGREENAAEDVAAICNEMEKLAVEAGCAVMYAAHFSKGNQAGKEAIDRISGSGVWARDADSMMIMTKHQSEDCYTVETILRNLPEQPPFVVRWQYPVMQIDDSLDPENLKQPPSGRKKEHDPKTFLQFIVQNTQANPISITEWAIKANIPRRTLSDYTEIMRLKGWIATTGEGRSARQFITPLGNSLATGEN